MRVDDSDRKALITKIAAMSDADIASRVEELYAKDTLTDAELDEFSGIMLGGLGPDVATESKLD